MRRLEEQAPSELWAGQITRSSSSVATNPVSKSFRVLEYMNPQLKC